MLEMIYFHNKYKDRYNKLGKDAKTGKPLHYSTFLANLHNIGDKDIDSWFNNQSSEGEYTKDFTYFYNSLYKKGGRFLRKGCKLTTKKLIHRTSEAL